MAVVAPDPFDYARPKTLDEALDALASGVRVAPLAGGTDLVTMRASGTLGPELVLDIKGIAELSAVDRSDSTLRVGAATRLADLLDAGQVADTALNDGAAVVGARQTRERATLGGNVCRSSPAGDTLPGLLVLQTEVEVRARRGDRRLPLADFFVGPGLNALEDDELLIALNVELGRGASAYRRLTYRAWMDLAVIGVAVWLDLDGAECIGARIALGGLARTPLVATDAAAALIGTDFGPDALAAATEAATAIVSPISDVRGTAEHRAAGLRALLPRVVATARDRASGSPG